LKARDNSPGTRAEGLAADHLERHGLVIVERNFRTRHGEIDLIARDGDSLVFVEVRLRSRGDFGGAAGIAEMLLQSQNGQIQLLPALPKAWENGSLKGVCARGGFVIDLEWKKGELTTFRLYSKSGGSAAINYHNQKTTLKTVPGRWYELNKDFKWSSIGK